MRCTSLKLTVVLLLCGAPCFAVCGYEEQLNNSGQDELVCVDTNQDGEIDTENDCCIRGGVTTYSEGMTASLSDDLCLNATQGDEDGQKQIVGCGDRTTYTGSANPTSFRLDNQYGESFPNFNGLIVEGSDGSSSSEATTSGTDVAHVTYATIGVPSSGIVGSAELCNAGGPAIRIMDFTGTPYVTRLTSLLSNQVSYLCAMAPLPLMGGGIEMFNVCTPVDTSGQSLITLEDGESVPTTLLPFRNGLAACGAEMAPTLSQVGLIALSLLLLAGGTWGLRRTSLGQDLPGA